MSNLEQLRKPMSKKFRFDVFKRDGFQCQYCGNVPPKVILEVDHIDPVANGGENDLDNLITACFDCNRGKSDRLLSSIPKTVTEKAEILVEREEQLKAYQQIVRQKQLRIEDEIDRVSDIYSMFVPEYELTERSRGSVRRFIEQLGAPEVEDAMRLACARFVYSDSKIFKYFCGICWNKIRRMEEATT
jgi:hypothetical protein